MLAECIKSYMFYDICFIHQVTILLVINYLGKKTIILFFTHMITLKNDDL